MCDSVRTRNVSTADAKKIPSPKRASPFHGGVARHSQVLCCKIGYTTVLWHSTHLFPSEMCTSLKELLSSFCDEESHKVDLRWQNIFSASFRLSLSLSSLSLSLPRTFILFSPLSSSRGPTERGSWWKERR